MLCGERALGGEIACVNSFSWECPLILGSAERGTAQVESVIRRTDLDAEPMKIWAAAFEERILPPGRSA